MPPVAELYLRSIPAHAGEPRPRSRDTPPTRVYPRACGGTHRKVVKDDGQQGLSPRMRGNPGNTADENERAGSIPAHAGEPGAGGVKVDAPQVYPRACGGTPAGLAAVVFGPGLSPRMRGNPIFLLWEIPLMGSIPAHAGEPLPLGAQLALAEGLSPRMRGEPLCANMPITCVRVYPRACGGTGQFRDLRRPV